MSRSFLNSGTLIVILLQASVIKNLKIDLICIPWRSGRPIAGAAADAATATGGEAATGRGQGGCKLYFNHSLIGIVCRKKKN
jgi:hypothetical protein